MQSASMEAPSRASQRADAAVAQPANHTALLEHHAHQHHHRHVTENSTTTPPTNEMNEAGVYVPGVEDEGERMGDELTLDSIKVSVCLFVWATPHCLHPCQTDASSCSCPLCARKLAASQSHVAIDESWR
jgi:hypothetical protein